MSGTYLVKVTGLGGFAFSVARRSYTQNDNQVSEKLMLKMYPLVLEFVGKITKNVESHINIALA